MTAIISNRFENLMTRNAIVLKAIRSIEKSKKSFTPKTKTLTETASKKYNRAKSLTYQIGVELDYITLVLYPTVFDNQYNIANGKHDEEIKIALSKFNY